MRKRLLSLALALVLCLGLTVPAAAAATITEIVSPDNYLEFLRNAHGGDFIASPLGFSEGVCWHGSTWTGYGAINADGKIIIPAHTYSEVKDFKNGYAWAKRNGAGWCVVDTTGRGDRALHSRRGHCP